jgi:prepilin-type N-terminal cleavage/methylation domain-containing protein
VLELLHFTPDFMYNFISAVRNVFKRFRIGSFRVSANPLNQKGSIYMISTYQRLKRQRDAGEINGFTLIELLIVIVVLGILAAVVIFALGGITGKSAVASCQADGATISTAIAAYNAQNPGTPLSTANYLLNLTTADAGNNQQGPYIQSWPNNYPHYAFQMTGTVLQVATGALGTAPAYGNVLATGGTPAADIAGGANAPWATYSGPASCSLVQ